MPHRLSIYNIFPLSFLVGILSLQFFSTLPSLAGALIVLLIACGIYLLPHYRKFFLIIIVGLLGFNWALFSAVRILSWELPHTWEGKNLAITGKVVSLPEHHLGYSKFILTTETIGAQKIKTRILLNWSTYHRDNLTTIHMNDELMLQVRLKRPHGLFNPGGFDFEQYLFAHHIRATGYVISGTLLNRTAHFWHSNFRERLRSNIAQALFHNPFTGVIVALVTGDQSGIQTLQWQTLRDTGTSYLVAIAGLHIGLVAVVVFWGVNFLWRRSRRLVLFYPAFYAATIAGLIAALIYSAVSGWSIPTQRALIMFTVFALALLLQRNLQAWRALLLSLFMVLVIDPLAVLQAGFWLSFAAVFFIAYALQNKTQKSVIKKYIYLQLVVLLGLLPFSLLFFQQMSLAAFFANIVALPGVCLVVVPLSLLGALLTLVTPYFGGWLLYLATKLMAWIWWYIELFTHWSWFNWYHPIFHAWVLLTTIIGVLFLLAPRSWWFKSWGILWLLPLIFYTPARPQNGEVWFSLLDVGQGLSAVVQTRNHVLVYDTGPRFATTDAGASVIIPYLRSLGRNKIDSLVISHGDEDHIGGAASLLKVFPTAIYTSVPEKFPQAQFCSLGQTWQWDGVIFSFLSPATDTNFTGNNASCVLKINVGDKTILLTGDIEKPTEEFLLQHFPNLKTTVLIAPHHGSNTSSSVNFVLATHPQYVLFPTGYRNRFHFPSPMVIKRYTKIGAQLLNVALTGEISLRVNRDNIVFNLYRVTNRHYWND